MALARPPVAAGAGGLGGWVLGELWRWAVYPSTAPAPAALFPGDPVLYSCSEPSWEFVLHFVSNEAVLHWRLVLAFVLLVAASLLLRLGFGGFVLALEFRPSRSGGQPSGPRRVAAYRSGASSSSELRQHG